MHRKENFMTLVKKPKGLVNSIKNRINEVKKDEVSSETITETENKNAICADEKSTENKVDENKSNELTEEQIITSPEKEDEVKDANKDILVSIDNTANMANTEDINTEENMFNEVNIDAVKLEKSMDKELEESKKIKFYVKNINKLALACSLKYKEIGDLLIEAEKELGKKGFTKLLESREIGLERTQARNYMKVSRFISDVEENGGSTHEIYRLGVDKVVQISRIEDKNIQNDLMTLVIEENLSVRPLKKVVKKLLENSELSPADAWEEVKTEPSKKNKTAEKTSDASNEGNEDFHKKYLDLQDKYNQLQTEHQRVLEEYEQLKQNINAKEGNSDNT